VSISQSLVNILGIICAPVSLFGFPDYSSSFKKAVKDFPCFSSSSTGSVLTPYSFEIFSSDSS